MCCNTSVGQKTTIKIRATLKTIVLRMDSRAAGNSRFASGGRTCKREDLCSYSALAQVDSLVLLCPPERKAAKR